MLTPRQQAALNTLTETTLMMEMAEQTARDIERDRLSRTLPRAAQALRRRLCRAAATVHEHLHTRARARVLRLGVPTGHHYDVQSAGGTYRVFLFTD